MIGLSIVIFCGYKLMRKAPFNYMILFLYTIVTSVLVASISAFVQPKYVMIAAIMTFGMFLGLTIFAFFIRADLTILRGMISTIGITLLLMIIFLILYSSMFIYIIVASLVIVLMSIYIIWDTRMIVGHEKYF